MPSENWLNITINIVLNGLLNNSQNKNKFAVPGNQDCPLLRPVQPINVELTSTFFYSTEVWSINHQRILNIIVIIFIIIIIILLFIND